MTASLGNKNTKKEWGGQHDTEMVAFSLILFNAVILLLLLFAASTWKLLSLLQGLVQLFLKYIVTRPIMDLCEWTTQRAGERVSWWWWEQKGIDLEKAKERAAEALATDSESESELELKAEVEVEAEPEVVGEERSTSSRVSGSSGEEWSGASVKPWS